MLCTCGPCMHVGYCRHILVCAWICAATCWHDMQRALLTHAPASWPASTFQVKFPKLLFPPMSQVAGRARTTKYPVHVTYLMHACHGTIASYSTRSGVHAIVPVKNVVESLKKAGGSVVLFSQRSVPLCPAISFKDRRLFLL